MPGTAGMFRAVARVLHPAVLLVVDPVMIATTGSRLFDAEATGVLLCEILPESTLVSRMPAGWRSRCGGQ